MRLQDNRTGNSGNNLLSYIILNACTVLNSALQFQTLGKGRENVRETLLKEQLLLVLRERLGMVWCVFENMFQ
jgi:hypothetical protein